MNELPDTCSACDFPIPDTDFLIWPDSGATALAVCGYCGSANARPISSNVVLNEAAATGTEALPTLGGD